MKSLDQIDYTDKSSLLKFVKAPNSSYVFHLLSENGENILHMSKHNKIS